MADPNKIDIKSPLLILIAAFLAFVGNYFGGTIAPKPEPLPVVEQWYVTRSGEVVEAPQIIAVANTLEKGSYELTGYPRAGKITRLGVTITADGNPPNPAPTPPVIPPAPPAPVPPKPTLTGFALEVYEHAKSLPPADCAKLATNYETVSSMIAAGGILTLDQAFNKLSTMNKSLTLSPDKWTSFSLWLGSQYDAKATSIKQAGLLMDETARGLKEVR
jgi:hypothetical protein